MSEMRYTHVARNRRSIRSRGGLAHSTVFSFERYERMRARSADYGEALVRTNLAVRCWLRRTGNHPKWSGEGDPPPHRVMVWLLANHILQAFYRQYGIDVIPFTVGDMYGYGMKVRPSEGCMRTDLQDTAWIACGSVRVDPQVPGLAPFKVGRRILRGQDPLWVIDTGAILAVGGRWPDRCKIGTCRHRHDAGLYLTVNQIITLLLCMGYLQDAILGTWVECSPWGVHPTDPPHPLRSLGFVDRPTFTYEFFELNPRWGAPIWIHRTTGELVTGAGTRVGFKEWCGGDVDRGLHYVCRLVEKAR